PLVARAGEAHAVHDVVETTLEDADQVLARAPLGAVRDVEVALELTLEHAVDATHLLLLAKADAVLGELDALVAVHARRLGTTRDRALLGVAAVGLEIELHPLAATELADGSDVTS